MRAFCNIPSKIFQFRTFLKRIAVTAKFFILNRSCAFCCQTPHSTSPQLDHLTQRRFRTLCCDRNFTIEGIKSELVFADGAKDDVQLSGDWHGWKAILFFTKELTLGLL